MSLKILVVDDILESRRALMALVRELGHDTLGADNGRDALAVVTSARPDVVLLDLLMPDLDGFEVTRRMRDLTADRWLPVIVTSALQGEGHFVHALENGADDYLSRPVRAGLLDAKLRHYARVLALQRRIAALAQRQRDILDNILDPVITLDAQGRVMEFNRAAGALRDPHGRPLAAGMECAALFGVDLADLLARHECTLHRAAEDAFTAEIGLSEWREAEAEHARYTLVLRDLTERRQVERMKDEFLATVSHELRTPLTSVLGALGLLAGGAAGELPAQARRLAEVARRNGERLGRLVDDVLDLTKLEGDRIVLHLRPQPPLPLLQEAVAAIQGYAERAQVRLLLEPWQEAALGAIPELRLDADRFLQVMANLLSNAIKHSPAGATVRVSLHAEGGGLCVTVRDQGPGIDPSLRARMFEKFTQADGTDRRVQGGTGLGLYITRMLVERMGGRVRCDEVFGAGAAFSVLFPPARAAAAPALPRVLHVDGDVQTRERVSRWLAPLAQVDGVARLAQPAAPQGAPALVIGNPQGQGSADDFCDALRRIAAGRPVLLYGDSVDAAFCRRMRLPWLSPARSSAAELTEWVRRALAGAPSEARA